MHTDSLIPIAFFVFIAYMVKIVSENRTRRFLIEKGQVNENVKFLFSDRFSYSVPSSLKWGMVLIAIGAAIIIGRILDAALPSTYGEFDGEAMTFALMFIFGGVALIVYYALAIKMVKKVENKE